MKAYFNYKNLRATFCLQKLSEIETLTNKSFTLLHLLSSLKGNSALELSKVLKWQGLVFAHFWSKSDNSSFEW